MKERLAWYKATIEVRSLLRKDIFLLTFHDGSKSRENCLHPQLQHRLHKVCLLNSHFQIQYLTPNIFPFPFPGISVTLQVQHGTFLSLASKTAAVDAELQKIKALYTQQWRSKTGSVRDPFNDSAKRSETPADFDLSSLAVR